MLQNMLSTSRRVFSTLRPVPPTMKHITYTPGCTPKGLVVAESPVPAVGRGDVLIQVAYSGVGGTDHAQRKGNFNPKPDSPPHHLIMGLEVSGLVAEVGADVVDFQPGDRVAALLYGGGYAEYAVAPQQQVCGAVQSAARRLVRHSPTRRALCFAAHRCWSFPTI